MICRLRDPQSFLSPSSGCLLGHGEGGRHPAIATGTGRRREPQTLPAQTAQGQRARRRGAFLGGTGRKNCTKSTGKAASPCVGHPWSARGGCFGRSHLERPYDIVQREANSRARTPRRSGCVGGGSRRWPVRSILFRCRRRVVRRLARRLNSPGHPSRPRRPHPRRRSRPHRRPHLRPRSLPAEPSQPRPPPTTRAPSRIRGSCRPRPYGRHRPGRSACSSTSWCCSAWP